MQLPSLTRRRSLAALTTALAAIWWPAAQAQETNIKFQLDWRFEGPAALFLVPVAKGYFKAEGLNVVVDAGNGSGGTVTRVASGAYDMGFADLAALMEFHANNPTAPNKPVAVMMVYNNTPAAVMALRKSGISTPADLNPPLHETMLVRGDIDAITGFSFTSILNLEARGIKADEIVVLPYPQYGVKLYGNVVIAGEDFLKKNPEAVKRFLEAFSKGVKDVIADPKAAIVTVKARDGIVNEELELRRLKLCLDATVLTPDARSEGFGNALAPRLSLMASQVSDAFGTKERINPAAVWNGSLLPSEADRNIFAAARK